MTIEDLLCAYVERSDQLLDFVYKEPMGISAEVVKECVYRQLRKESYSVKKSSKAGKDPDVEGSSWEGAVVVEAKGEGSRPEMFYNLFLAAVG